jgi:hypothetical protein
MLGFRVAEAAGEVLFRDGLYGVVESEFEDGWGLGEGREGK